MSRVSKSFSGVFLGIHSFIKYLEHGRMSAVAAHQSLENETRLPMMYVLVHFGLKNTGKKCKRKYYYI